jgi:ribosomal protein S12 methylthiotransferase accessory factor YcaO
MDAIADLLSSRTPKRYWSGTHRAVPPRQTWDRIAPLLPRFGITRVADITGLDRINIPVATAIRPMSRSIAVAAGKGVDLVAAKTSAAMEAIECAHADGSLPAAHFRRRDHSTRELLHYPFAIANTRRFNDVGENRTEWLFSCCRKALNATGSHMHLRFLVSSA